MHPTQTLNPEHMLKPEWTLRTRMKSLATAFFIFIFALLFAVSPQCDTTPTSPIPPHVYLTWSSTDTAQTMTVIYHSDSKLSDALIHYDTSSLQAEIEKYSHQKESAVVLFDGKKLAPNRNIHYFELENLAPNTTYYFVISDSDTALTKEFKFKTLPADDTPVRFVNGGDMGTSDEVDKLHKIAAQKDPMLAIIGGDIAYENGSLAQYKLWDTWLNKWQTQMVKPTGELIPFVLAVGNHETTKGYATNGQSAPFFQAYYNKNNPLPYRYVRAGANAAFIALDTGHLTPIGGAQKEWLEKTINDLNGVEFRIPLYHVPMYPSARGYDDQIEMELARAHWLPLFDLYDLPLAFEHHDHALKRTKKLKKNQVHNDGTTYLGDGCWGRPPRSTKKQWYLEKASGARHIWYGEIHPQYVDMLALDNQGKILDQVRISP